MSTIQKTIAVAWAFKWRVASYFCTAFFGTLGSAFTTSNSGTTWKEWAIASCVALGVAFGNIKSLFDQNIDTVSDEKTP